jgi:aspartate racemase
MRTLGLIGGMSAESTTVYYQTLNRLVRERLGGLHSAKLILWSVDFAPIAELQAQGDWDATGRELAAIARRLETAGAEAILICANTMHLNAPEVQAAVKVPLIHIGDATAAALKARGVRRPLLLGTRFTMEKPFYAERLRAAGLEPVLPDGAERDRLHAIIYDELVTGVINPASKAEVLAMIAGAQATGADGVIFGCTEIGLLIDPAELAIPAVDTAIVHCEAAAAFALGDR